MLSEGEQYPSQDRRDVARLQRAGCFGDMLCSQGFSLGYEVAALQAAAVDRVTINQP